jgi:predicted lysophospholipase L1 biosynthesis ABC-type transport system permease subunit
MLGPAPAVLPVVISTSLAVRPDGVKLGDEFQIAVDAYKLPVRVVAVRDSIAGITTPGVIALISRTQMRELEPGLQLAPSVLFVDAPPGRGPEIQDAVTTITPAARVEDRAALEQRFTTSPVTAAIVAGGVVTSLIAAVYAAIAVTSALVMAGRARAAETAKLRTLGLSRGQATAMTVVEHGPTVVVAFLAGAALGLGLFAMLEPGLGLDALVGSRVDVPLTPDPVQLVLTFAGIVMIAVVGIALAVWMERRSRPIAALRIGAE